MFGECRQSRSLLQFFFAALVHTVHQPLHHARDAVGTSIVAPLNSVCTLPAPGGSGGALPRLPVLGWASLGGAHAAGFPSLLDRRSIVRTSSGRAAILLALEAIGTMVGEQVLVPSYHCPTMVSPVHTLGARPMFYPLTECGAPDLDWLSRQDLRGVKAMLAVHFFGLPQPMEAVAAWCRERAIALVEDCAHALFGRAGSRPIGSWGTFAIGSLKKFLPVADGGCLAINEAAALPPLTAPSPVADLKALVGALELGASHGRLRGAGWAIIAGVRTLRWARSTSIGAAPPDGDGDGNEAAAPATLDAALSHRRITRPSDWLSRWLPRSRIVERRRRHYMRLTERLAACRSLRPLMPALPDACVPYVFPLWVQQPDPGYQELRRRGVPVYRWDSSWPDMPTIPGDSGPAWSHHVLQIGCHQDLANGDVDEIADLLLQIFGVDRSCCNDGA